MVRRGPSWSVVVRRRLSGDSERGGEGRGAGGNALSLLAQVSTGGGSVAGCRGPSWSVVVRRGLSGESERGGEGRRACGNALSLLAQVSTGGGSIVVRRGPSWSVVVHRGPLWSVWRVGAGRRVSGNWWVTSGTSEYRRGSGPSIVVHDGCDGVSWWRWSEYGVCADICFLCCSVTMIITPN